MEALRIHRVVWPLAAAETIVWAACYYAFPALLLIWERDLGWGKAELSGAFTLALVVSAALAPVVGRLIDRGHARQLFAGSAALGGLLLLALAQITTLWQFYAVWLGLGAAMAGSLYEACFAVLTRTLGPSARQGITAVALIAGFAGTLSFPSAHLLSSWLGWRGTVLVFGAAVLLIAVPLIWMACGAAGGGRTAAPSVTAGAALRVMRLSAFWWIAVLFAAVALNHNMLLTHLLPILDERGIPPDMAVLAASLIGPMQVAGRIVMTTLGRRASTLMIFRACLAATAFAALALLAAGAAPVLLFAFVAFQGAGYGVTSIVRPVFVAERLGRRNFGIVAGLLAVAFVGGSAAAPTLAALLWGSGGYDLVIGCALATAALGLVALAAAGRPAMRRPASGPR